MVVKVKEPVKEGVPQLPRRPRPLHLPPPRPRSPSSPTFSFKRGVTGIAYETVKDRAGTLPLLTPMSRGRRPSLTSRSVPAYLEKEHGGRGVLLGGVPGVPPGNVCIIGGGIVGTNAAKMALGLRRQSNFGGSQPEPPPRPRRHLQRPRLHSRLQLLQHRARCPRGRPPHRRSPHPRRRRPQDRHQTPWSAK